MRAIVITLALFSCLYMNALFAEVSGDGSRDILVTFENRGGSVSGGISAPYRFRKRYELSERARQLSEQISNEYGFSEVDDWPIKSLSVYCFIYRLAVDDDRDDVLQRLNADVRIESAQAMNQFKTSATNALEYDDKYIDMQRGLQLLGVTTAHNHSRGKGVRIAVIDSHAAVNHEDLRGRIKSVTVFSDASRAIDNIHGTAITSVIGASANNALGIVGVAPDSEIDLLVACWADANSRGAVCDTFSLAKALDAVTEDPPEVLNMSLIGPYDPLLHRLIAKVRNDGVVIIAAGSVSDKRFPASEKEVISVSSSDDSMDPGTDAADLIRAPADQIMVATPNGGYEFQSGTSIAAAHVSGIVALLISASPDVDRNSIESILRQSQRGKSSGVVAVDACRVLSLVDNTRDCLMGSMHARTSKLETGT